MKEELKTGFWKPCRYEYGFEWDFHRLPPVNNFGKSGPPNCSKSIVYNFFEESFCIVFFWNPLVLKVDLFSLQVLMLNILFAYYYPLRNSPNHSTIQTPYTKIHNLLVSRRRKLCRFATRFEAHTPKCRLYAVQCLLCPAAVLLSCVFRFRITITSHPRLLRCKPGSPAPLVAETSR